MLRLIQFMSVILLCVLGAVTDAQAQPFIPPHPLAQIGMHPLLGPICLGVSGLVSAPCQAVHQHLQIEERAALIYQTVPRLPPFWGMEMCNGPMGPGQCVAVTIIGWSA